MVMSFDMGPSPERKIVQPEQIDPDLEYAELCADVVGRHPNPTIIKEPNEREKKVFELRRLIADFEAKYLLKDLRAIEKISPDLELRFQYADDLEDPRRILKDLETYRKQGKGYELLHIKNIAKVRAIVLNPEDRERFIIRRGAKKALALIMKLLKEVGDGELKEKCSLLQKALGTPRKGEINHD